MTDKDRIRILRRAVAGVAGYLEDVNELLDGASVYPDWKTNKESGVGGEYRVLKTVLQITRRGKE